MDAEGEPEQDETAERELDLAPFDPVVQGVDVAVYTLLLGAPALIMLFFGARWVWLCFVGLAAAAWGSRRVAEWLVDRMHAWLGRPRRR